MTETPAIDALGEKTVVTFLDTASSVFHQRGGGSADSLPDSERVKIRTYLRSLDDVDARRVVYHLRTGRPFRDDTPAMAAGMYSHRVGLDFEFATNVSACINHVESTLDLVTQEQLDLLYSLGEDIGPVLLELYGMDEEAMDPSNTGHLNFDDGLEINDLEYPQQLLNQLIGMAVAARLMKTRGAELLIAWLDAIDEPPS